MFDWQKLLKMARLALADAADSSPEEARLSKIAKYCKYRLDVNIYQRKETVIFWDASERMERETKVNTEITKAANFGQYCDSKYRGTIIEKIYIY